MRRRTSVTVAVAILAILVLASTAIAQEVVRVTNPNFAWAGKQDQTANYTWSSTVNNPSSHEVRAEVTVQLLDSSGGVLASDSQMVSVMSGGTAPVNGRSSLAYDAASRATQYRVVIAAAE